MNPSRKSPLFIILLSALIMTLVSLNGLSLLAAEGEGTEISGQAEKKEAPKKKLSTTPFEAGMIVVKEKALASIESAGTTTEISEQDMKARGDKTLDNAMQMVPGINVYQNRKGGMVFDARGIGHSRYAILVDGIPLEEVYGGGGGDISRIPIMNASKIIVSKGVVSSLYGTGGTLGAINVISKRPEELYAEAVAEYGLSDNWTLNVAAGAPMGNAYFWLSGMVIHSGGYEISEKLSHNTRRKWFDRFVQYGLYGQTYETLTLSNKYNYIYDDNRWNHTNYTKYQMQAKFGYNISDNMEVGVTAYYYHNRQDFNYFQPNSLTYYDIKSSTWKEPTAPPTVPNAYENSDKSSIIVNNAWVWPEDYNYLVSPYFYGEFGDLKVKANVFFQQQLNTLEPYANQEHTAVSFPSGTYSAVNKTYNDRVQSTYLDTMTGFSIYPSYKITDWNKVTVGVLFNYQIHKDYEKAIDATATGVIGYHGTDRYLTRQMEMANFTLALEDEMKFATPVGDVAIIAGISYDMQDLTNYRKRDGSNLATLNLMIDGYTPSSDSSIMGTRDSFNPVFGVIYDPIESLLRIRTSFSRKTEFPSMSVYSTNDSQLTDIGIDPEVTYNFNAGAEVFILEGAVSFRCDYFMTKFIDKIEKVYDPTIAARVYTNIDGVFSQGLEATVTGEMEDIFDIADVTASISYMYLNSKNEDDSAYTYGERLEKVPMHQIVGQLTMKFFTGTNLVIWGNHVRNQILYTMAGRVNPLTQPYTTAYYRQTRLHDPWMLNLKVAQTIPWLDERFSVYFMVKNILDDYNADPFNPGAGRNFFFGGSAKL